MQLRLDRVLFPFELRRCCPIDPFVSAWSKGMMVNDVRLPSSVPQYGCGKSSSGANSTSASGIRTGR